MTIEKAVFRLAGIMILASILLTLLVHEYFIWLAGFIGINFIQLSFTGLCPAKRVFSKLGLKPEGEA